MSRRLVAFVLLAMGVSVAAQSRPDFSGVWVPGALKTPAPAATGGSVGLPPSDLTIQHTAVALSISRTDFDIVTTQTYKLDGSESTTKTGAVTRLSHARWEGPRLIIEGKASQVTSAGYAAWTFKDTYSIDARGRLILETQHNASDGTVTSSIKEYTRKPPK